MGLDEEIFRAINTGMSNPFLDPPMILLSFIGSLYLSILWVMPLWFLSRRERAHDYLLALVIVTVVVEGLKWFFDRPRPPESLSDVRLLAVPFSTVGNGSFPSGHAARAGLLIPAFWREHRWRSWPIELYVLGMSLSRIYVGVHFPSDVVAGTAIGIILGGVVVFCLDGVSAYRTLRSKILDTLTFSLRRGERGKRSEEASLPEDEMCDRGPE